MKKTQWIYKGIAAVLAIALVFGLVMMGKGLQPKGPAELSGNTQDILPEAEKAIPDQTDGENSQEDHDETEPPETEPPETEPPETEPPETKPEETEPPETKPQEEVPPQTEPEQHQTFDRHNCIGAKDIVEKFEKRRRNSTAEHYVHP